MSDRRRSLRPADSARLALALVGMMLAGPPQEAVAVENPDRGGELGEVAVIGTRAASTVETTEDTSSSGVVEAARLQSRPLLRTADLLEWVPGMVVTQHSGDGKANQYFLRGFNLDHGTDFATTVDGVPLNLPSHAHGQGYTDLNVVIPELVRRIEFRKGPYFAQDGDFSSAGAADLILVDRLDSAFGQITLGGNGYRRVVGALSPGLGQGRLLLGMEGLLNDGPWEVAQHARRLNAIARYSTGTDREGFSLTATAYDSSWTSTDQVAERALDAGLIGRYGSLDSTTGGESSRWSLSARLRHALGNGWVDAQIWALHYRLDLFSNFTWALNRPDTGDQFEQTDRRDAGGLKLSRTLHHDLAGVDTITTVGLQARQDRIQSGLFDSVARQRIGITRDDRVDAGSLGLYAQSQAFWSEWLRTVAGLRVDRLRNRVEAQLDANSGQAQGTQVSPKFSAVLTPVAGLETFVSIGRGFHSNDARGTLTRIDPRTGESVDPAPTISPTLGQELGLRWSPSRNLQLAMTGWWLSVGSELVFVGDAGTTEPSRESRRRGGELSLRWLPRPWLAIDADWAQSRARFIDGDPAGPFIPGAVAAMASFGLSLRDAGPWTGGLHLRYIGSRPLTEDGTVRSQPFTLADLRLGYRLGSRLSLMLDVLNLTGSRASDIEYWYRSRLPGEALAGVEDRHLHPAEPRTVRLSLRASF